MAEIARQDQPRVVVILGPTGAGKSKLAIELAEQLGGEIISADSMQVYKYMDIGTAKPTLEEQKRARHHLIDLVAPDESFSAELYRRLAGETINQLHRKGEPIWVVGGTGLYIKALTQGLFASPKIQPQVRERLKREAEEKGGDYLYRRLDLIDPNTASRLHPHDLFRTIRALEIFDSTGIPISSFREAHHFSGRPYLTLTLGVEMDRDELYHRIEERVDRMIDQGLLQEVEGLMEMGYGPDLKPMQGLGYKQVVQFLSKKIGWSEAVRQIKRDTRRYAKRQWTWFKAVPEVHWRNGATDQARIFGEAASFLGKGP